jgi:hypothetical protein
VYPLSPSQQAASRNESRPAIGMSYSMLKTIYVLRILSLLYFRLEWAKVNHRNIFADPQSPIVRMLFATSDRGICARTIPLTVPAVQPNTASLIAL